MNRKGKVAGCVSLFALALLYACGGGGGGTNPVTAMLNSLPNAAITGDIVSEVSSGVVQDSPLQNFEIPSLSYSCLASLVARGVKWDCTPRFSCLSVTDNSTYPTGTTIDFKVEAGPQCTDYFGSYRVKGTIDTAKGTENVSVNYDNFGTKVSCYSDPSKSLTITANGTESTVGSGLLDFTSNFNNSFKANIAITYSGGCAQEAISEKGFLYVDWNYSGKKSGTTWNFASTGVYGEKYMPEASYYGGLYSNPQIFGWFEEKNETGNVDTKGTPTDPYDDAGSITASGRIGWINAGSSMLGQGKVSIKLAADFDHYVCSGEPVARTMEIVSGDQKAVVLFDGPGGGGCGCFAWTLNTTPQSPICWGQPWL